jgi:N-acetylglucosamine repressor
LNGAQNQTSEITFPTGSALDGFYDRLAETLRAARNTDGRQCLLAAICLPGLIDRRSGKSVFCPNIHWMENTAPAIEVETRLKFQARVLHEEKALSLTNENGQQNFLLLDFSSGVGAGVVCDGKLLSGHSGFAGEFGHITVDPDGQLCGCGNRGCLETVASDRAFFQALDSTSKAKAVNSVLKYQTIGLAAAINLFNPQAIYVHTTLAREVPDYLERIREQTKARALAPSAADCVIELAEAGKLQGAALHAIDCALQATYA